MKTTTGRRLLALASLGLLGLAACGGNGGSSGEKVATLGSADPPASSGTGGGSASGGSGTDPQTRQKALLAYAQCMRDHGVDMKDPTFDANGRPQFNGGGGAGGGFFGRGANADDPTFQKAQQACRSNLQGLQGQFNLDPQQEAELRKNLLAFAQCMRDNGVDMQDPTFDANGRPQFNGGGGGGPAAGANRNDPVYQKAFEACQSKIGSFRPGGRGGPGGPATTADANA